jgi:hypothetical protein
MTLPRPVVVAAFIGAGILALVALVLTTRRNANAAAPPSRNSVTGLGDPYYLGGYTPTGADNPQPTYEVTIGRATMEPVTP